MLAGSRLPQMFYGIVVVKCPELLQNSQEAPTMESFFSNVADLGLQF